MFHACNGRREVHRLQFQRDQGNQDRNTDGRGSSLAVVRLRGGSAWVRGRLILSAKEADWISEFLR
jgi:hypothetical protein